MKTKQKKPRKKRPDAIIPEPRTPLGVYLKAKYGPRDYHYRLRVATGKVHSPKRYARMLEEVPEELRGECRPYAAPKK